MTLSPDDRGRDDGHAPGSERVAKAPFPANEQLINMEAPLSAPITSDDHAQGPTYATVTLVQYGDYECPYTRMSRHSVHQLQRQYPETLRFVFRHFPLEAIHPHARAAAMAAEATGAQTDFWTMHEYLFEHQQALAESDLHRYALELRLDADRFEHDRRSSRVIDESSVTWPVARQAECWARPPSSSMVLVLSMIETRGSSKQVRRL